MRIISGKFKGRKFFPPADKWPTRPTTDVSKEGLFNILSNELDFEDMVMLDLFGGTGNHCYECISRGCTDATYVDLHVPAVKFVTKIASELKIEQYISINRQDVFQYLKQNQGAKRFSYCFAGPPYPLPNLDAIPDKVFEAEVLTPEGLLVLEHNPDHDFSQHPHFQRMRHYGKTRFSFFSAPQEEE